MGTEVSHSAWESEKERETDGGREVRKTDQEQSKNSNRKTERKVQRIGIRTGEN